MDENLLQALMSDPELAKTLASMGVFSDREALNGQRMGLGSQMMATPQPEGRQVGNTYVASSPLEHLAAAVRQGLGGYEMARGRRGQQSLIDQDVNARMRLAQALASRQPQTAPGQLPVAGGGTVTPMDPYST